MDYLFLDVLLFGALPIICGDIFLLSVVLFKPKKLVYEGNCFDYIVRELKISEVLFSVLLEENRLCFYKW